MLQLAMAATHSDDVPAIVNEEFEDFTSLRGHEGFNAQPTFAMTLPVAA
jgi:hypothetical protein